jgi:phosphate transport system permease protein
LRVGPEVEAGALSLRTTGRARRRKAVNRTMEALATVSALVAVAVLCAIVWSVFSKGVQALSWDFLTKTPVTFGETGGGVAQAIVGSALLIGMAAALAIPVGVLIAIYVSEFAPRLVRRSVQLALDVLNGVPSIVIGIFIFALLIVGHHQSAIAGSVALAIIMLPLVARSTQEVLALVPRDLREASFALGISRWRTILGVVLPTALGGILTGATLAVARVAGETAPLLFTSSVAPTSVSWDVHQAVSSLPLTIFQYSEAPDPSLNAQAWAAAFVLISFVLVASLTARTLLVRQRRKLGQTR